MEAKPMKDRIQMLTRSVTSGSNMIPAPVLPCRSNAMENHFGAFAKLKKRGDRFPVSSF